MLPSDLGEDAGTTDAGQGGARADAGDAKGAGGSTVATDGGTGGRGAGGSVGGAGTGGAPAPGAGGASGGAGGASGGAGGATGPQAPAHLTGTTTGDYGDAEVAVNSAPMTWTISNDGDLPSSVPALSNGAPDELIVTNGCTAAIAGHAKCTIAVAVKPAAPGAFSSSLLLSATTGGGVIFYANAIGRARITIVKSGAGSGVVTSTPAGISCGSTCSSLYLGTGRLQLSARTSNGSSSVFTGWGGLPGCAGPTRECFVTVTQSLTITANFAAMTSNLIFTTSSAFSTSAGSAAAYDASCNAAATAAGINDATGTMYVAVTSDAASQVTRRLGTAQGWVRMDGQPFASTASSLFTGNAVFNAIHFDETGYNPGLGGFLMTGALPTGDSAGTAANCMNFTLSSGGAMAGGNVSGGPRSWINGAPAGTCSGTYSLICMGKTRTAAVSPVVTAGRKIWLSNSPLSVGGALNPDQLCQSSLPAGVTGAAALIQHTVSTPAIDAATTYVRPDGTLVGTGNDLSSLGGLKSGIWQSANLSYGSLGASGASFVWTGGAGPGQLGDASGTCADWTQTALAAGIVGNYAVDQGPYWNAGMVSCASSAGVYCFQTAP